MTGNNSNNHNGILIQETNAHGQAAIFLVESLIHILVEQDVLSLASAVEVVDTAIEVKADVDAQTGDTSARSRTSADMLQAIGASLRRDIPA